MDNSVPSHGDAELFGAVLPEKRATQSSKKIVDFNVKVLKPVAVNLVMLAVLPGS